MRRSTSLVLIVLTSTPIACGDGSTPAKPAKGPPAAETPDPGPWRFRPTLEQHLPAEAVAEPILELSLPRQRTVVVLAAVVRKGNPDVGVERWTFEQTPGEETLRLREGGERLLRLQAGTRHPELGDLRRTLATPRAVLTRPVGLPGNDPAAVLEQVVAASATMRDAKADPEARVEATATLVRGLDDAVVFERDAIGQLADVLATMPEPIQVEMKSERRSKITFESEGRTVTLELQRKTDGWAISSLDAPPVPRPEPAGDSGTAGGTADVVEL